jgi:hypothetical protein
LTACGIAALAWTLAAIFAGKVSAIVEDSLREAEDAYAGSAVAEIPSVREDVPEPYTDGARYPDSMEYKELSMLAKTVWGEARGCSVDEQTLVLWTVFNRVDSGMFGHTLEAVITAPGQFQGYDPDHPVDDWIYKLCAIEYDLWKGGGVAPVIKPYAMDGDYLFFEGDGAHNWFRSEW